MSTLGVKNIKVEAIGLGSYQNTVDVSEEIKVEVIKDKPTVTNFGYSESNSNEILINYAFNDKDKAIKSATIIVTDENQKEIKRQTINTDTTRISFTRTSSQTYNFKMLLDYDLDTNAIETGKNEVENEIALDEQIALDKRMIEMKDIQDVYLYQKTDDDVREIYSISPNELDNNLDSYLIRVQMKDLPDFYATIKRYIIEDNKLKFELEYEDIIQYIGNNYQNELVITFGSIIAGVAKNDTFESLIREMNSNPYAKITLTKDYDATGFYGNGKALIYPEGGFRGSFNGAGHTIYNLSTPLFSTLENAVVQNLILENVLLTTVGANTLKGSIAEEAYRTSISNVHVKNFNMTTGDATSKYGALVGEISTNTTLNGCSASNININAKTPIVGGLVGLARYNSVIENCYVIGNINATATNISKMVISIGGICGYVESTEPSTITHCLTKVNITSTDGPAGNGGILGNASNGSIILKENVSLSTGSKAYRVFGGKISDGKSSDNYELISSNLDTNMDEGYRYTKKIESTEDITGRFFEEKVGFLTNNWVLDNVSYDKLPVLRNSDPNRNEANSEIYIPSHDRLKTISGYDPNKVIAYSNVYKLMPFYDSKYIITDGNKINEDNILNTKTIKTVLAYDNGHKLITSLTEENKNYKSISFIKVVFTDNTTKDYEVTYKDFYGHIVCYEIDELGIEYNYDKYVIKKDTGIVSELVNYIQNLNYSSELEKIATVEYGKRIYRDYFNETTKNMAKDFVLKYLENVRGYSVTIDNQILNTVIRNNLLNNDRLKEIMFAYNYYLRWYNIDIQGAKVSDMMLFKGELYSKNMGIEYLTKEIKTSKWLNSPHTKYFYRDNIGHRTGIATISSFMDYNISVLGNYEKTDDWLTENFSGILVELPLEEHPDIDYRAWTQLKKQESYLLAILTLPKNAGYMMSGPTMFMVGSQKVYISNPQDAKQRAQLQAKLQDYGKKYITTFYNTVAGFIEPQYMNSFADIQMDKPYIIGSTEEQEKEGRTQDPFNKNFYEAMYNWHRISGVAAYAQDGEMYWVAYAAIGNEWNYINTWTHESGHNQAVKLFLKDNGRRPSGNTITVDEDYPDGNTTQEFGDGAVNFNLSFNYPVDAMVTTNLTTERINSKDKIESYYKEMFEAIDFLDYAEAKAFLKLTPKEQSIIAVQVYYSGSTVGWRALSEEQFAEMNLQTISDIYDKHITIRPNSAGTTQGAYGAYGSEGMYVRRWYQPHNDSGRTHSYGLKYTAWQMLGEGGYDGGYVTYYSGKSSNDLDAIRKVTGDPEMTWRKYKLGRYDLMENNWNNAYINSDELVEKYVQALKADAANNDRSVAQSTNIRRANYHYLKRVTNDLREKVLVSKVNPIHITNAQEFKELITKDSMGYFILDNDIDFSSIDSEDTIIGGCFAGYIDAKGHKLTGNVVPIFNNIKFASISNLEIDGSNITATSDNVGAFAKTATYVKLENITGKGINVTSTGKQIGGLIGTISNSTMKNVNIVEDSTKTIISGSSRVGTLVGYVEASDIYECRSNSSEVTASGESVGGLIGEAINNTTIQDSTFTGKVKGNKGVGGIVGFTTNSTLENTEVTNTIVSNTNIRTGGIAGHVESSKIENATINNVNISGEGEATGGAIGVIVGTAIKNVNVTESTVSSTNKVGGLVGYVGQSTIEESSSNSEIIASGNSAGGLIGEMINSSTVQNCNTSGTVKGNRNVGGIIGNISNSTVKGASTKEMTVSGSSNVGGLAGYASTSTIEESSSNITVTATGNVAGGFIAEVVSSTNIENCYSIGQVNGKEEVGGFVGKLNSSSISNCLSNNTAVGTQAAGFISQSTNNSKIQNSIAIGNQSGLTYKFDNRTAKDQIIGYSNNYEYEEASGKSIEIKATLDMKDIDFSDKISVAKRADIINMDFYINTLGWNNEIWDFTNITGGLIGIKGKYNDEKINIINPEITKNRYEISSANEFIQKINEEPDAIFEIMNDIDFSGKTYSGSLITSDFTGIIEGNNHTLSNLKDVSLFNRFMGEVHNLNISGFVNTTQNTNYMSLFAKRSANAVFSNMKIAGYVIGRNYVGIVSGEDTSSTFENISIVKYKNSVGYDLDSRVQGNSNIGVLVGSKSGGSIKNCYIAGVLISNSGNNIGGITGTSIGKVTIENIISNVAVDGRKASGKTGGFIGNISEETIIRNSISMGRVAGNVAKKFTGASDEIIAKTIQNCYEYNEALGNSSINENTNNYIKMATKDNLLDKTFYINIVGLNEETWNFDNLGREIVYTSGGRTWTEQIIYPELR